MLAFHQISSHPILAFPFGRSFVRWGFPNQRVFAGGWTCRLVQICFPGLKEESLHDCSGCLTTFFLTIRLTAGTKIIHGYAVLCDSSSRLPFAGVFVRAVTPSPGNSGSLTFPSASSCVVRWSRARNFPRSRPMPANHIE